MRIGNAILVVEDCVFIGNGITSGGVLRTWGSSYSSLRFVRCDFSENAGMNGGVLYTSRGKVVFESCMFRNNTSLNGGVAFFELGELSFLDCVITGNTTASHGRGGVVRAHHSDVLVESSLIAGNQAGGASVFDILGMSNLTLVSSTLVENSSFTYNMGAIYLVGANSTIDNCILWNDEEYEIHFETQEALAEVSCSNVHGGWVGDMNLNEDPLFCLPGDGDYYLRSDSPCAPENNHCGQLMGVLPVACETEVSTTSWSILKSHY
jgi:hypothetical protein